MVDENEDLQKGPWFPEDMEPGKRLMVRDLVLATKNGDDATVKEILMTGEVDIDSKYRWETALMVAARLKNTKLCSMLLDHGADCNITRIFNQTALWIATFHGNLPAMELMISTNKCTQTNLDNTFLRSAAMNFLQGCLALLKAGASVSATDSMGFMAIHRAAGTNETDAPSNDMWRVCNPETWRIYHCTSLELCELFLSWDADVNALDSVQSTPLHHATESGRDDVCRLLIENGADVNAIGGIFQKTPLHIAVANDYPVLVEMLLNEPNITPNIVDVDHETPLMTAIKLHKKECVRIFLRHDDWSKYMSVSVTSQSEKGTIDTPMRLMIRHMPDMATEVMDKCIELSTYKDAKHPDFTARFNFAFMDDTYTSTHWDVGGITSVAFSRSEDCVNINKRTPATSGVKGRIQHKKGKDKLDGLPLPRDVPNGPRSSIGIGGLTRRRATLSDPLVSPGRINKLMKERTLPCDSRCFSCTKNTSRCHVIQSAKPYIQNRKCLKINHPLSIAYAEKCTQVLCHPLAVALINHKWRKIARFSFYGRLILNAAFVALLTTHVILSKDRPINKLANFTVVDVVSVILLILACMLLAKEVFCITTQFSTYFTSLRNYVELFLYSSTMALVLLDGILSQRLTQYPLAAVTVFIAWFHISLYMRMLPRIGIFFIMFTRILKNTIIVLFIFSPILLGFSFTFNILMDDLPLFGMKFSLATVLVMLSGEVEYMDTMTSGAELNTQVRSKDMAIAAYVFFIVIMVICLLNLLVGLAVSDVDTLHKVSEAEMITLKAEEVLSSEFYGANLCLKKAACGCLRYQPNKKAACFSKAPGTSPMLFYKRISAWLNTLDFRDYRLNAVNLLRIFRKQRTQDYDALRREIAQLRSLIDTSFAFSPGISRTESRYSRKIEIAPPRLLNT